MSEAIAEGITCHMLYSHGKGEGIVENLLQGTNKIFGIYIVGSVNFIAHRDVFGLGRNWAANMLAGRIADQLIDPAALGPVQL